MLFGMKFLFTFAFIVVGSVGSAQEATLSQKLNGIKTPLTAMAIAGAADVTSTFTSYSTGESNPAVAWMQPHVGFEATVAIGVGLEAVAVVWICHKLCEHHPKLAKTLTWTAAGAHGFFASYNWARRQRHYNTRFGWQNTTCKMPIPMACN